MSEAKPAFVFVHGAWHSGRCWDKVIGSLTAAGFRARAVDLPGAGADARMPACLKDGEPDPEQAATEPSPAADITQSERNAVVIAAVREAAAQSGGKVVLVGHSMGGVTITPVAEAEASSLHALVYLTAFMLPPDMPAVAMILHETMRDAVVPSLFLADPQQVGALRIHAKSRDPAYLQRLHQAFYGDLPIEDMAEIQQYLHSDEPAGVAAEPSPMSRDGVGRLPRHYIRCTQDRAITMAGQDFMIEAVDMAIGGKTVVHRLESSHSPFFSQPEELARMLIDIAR